MKKLFIVVATAFMFMFINNTYARQNLNVVGSSTVYPFATVVAEHFSHQTNYSSPIIESTGSGGGIKLLCSGVGGNFPDISNASRSIKESEIELCASNGISKPTEFKFGYDGIVIGNHISSEKMNLSLRDLYLALAKKVPNDNGKLIMNPYTNWSEVNPELPDKPIKVLGPPPTSGTRDAFAEIALEGGCKTFSSIANSDELEKVCHTIRNDGVFIEVGENDTFTIQKLVKDKDRVGIFGFSFLNQNKDKVQGSAINNFDPTFDNITNGDYPISRELYFYVKREHVSYVPGMFEYLSEFTSENAIGQYGYLVDNGLIPVSEKERRKIRKKVELLKQLQK